MPTCRCNLPVYWPWRLPQANARIEAVGQLRDLVEVLLEAGFAVNASLFLRGDFYYCHACRFGRYVSGVVPNRAIPPNLPLVDHASRGAWVVGLASASLPA